MSKKQTARSQAAKSSTPQPQIQGNGGLAQQAPPLCAHAASRVDAVVRVFEVGLESDKKNKRLLKILALLFIGIAAVLLCVLGLLIALHSEVHLSWPRRLLVCAIGGGGGLVGVIGSASVTAWKSRH